MYRTIATKTKLAVVFGFATGVLVGLAVVTTMGLVFGRNESRLIVPEIPLHAAASYASENMAAATGLIDDQVEGLFTLDFITGELSCAVMALRGGRTAKIGAVYRQNVVADLGIERTKKPKYLLVTGLANFVGRGGNTRLASSVAYVIDANTGGFAAYGVPWNTSAAARGGQQMAPMVLLDKGTVRTMAAIRE